MKKILALVSLVVLFGLLSFSFAQTQVESGNWVVNQSTSNYTLDKNQGNRIMTINVTFDKPFDVKPEIVLNVTLLEASEKTPLRYDVSAGAISRDGFSITIKTWGDTQIQTIGGSWLAHAQKSME